MIPEKQLKALLHLLDDPDEEVASAVVNRILSFGNGAIPQLEKAWEYSKDEAFQVRLETLIHRVHFSELSDDFRNWDALEDPGLLQGAILVSRYAYPGLRVETLLAQFERIRLNVWLEINTYLSPVEQISALNSILYGYYRLGGSELSRKEPAPFFLNAVLDSRQGNAFSLGILYLALAERLDVPLFAVSIPQQFLLAYMDAYQPSFPTDENDLARHIRFYVDPVNGNVYSPFDVAAYLHKAGTPLSARYFVPLTARKIIRRMLGALALAYAHQKQEEKASEVRLLQAIVAEEPEDDF